jgi:hypothetical protein
MQVEIPPELENEIVDVVTAVPGHGPTIQEIVRVTADRLFAVWAERLTSDEAVDAACRASGYYGSPVPVERRQADRALRARRCPFFCERAGRKLMPVTIVHTADVEKRAYRRGYFDAMVQLGSRSSLSLSQIDWLRDLIKRHAEVAGRTVSPTLDRMRAELTREDGRG